MCLFFTFFTFFRLKVLILPGRNVRAVLYSNYKDHTIG